MASRTSKSRSSRDQREIVRSMLLLTLYVGLGGVAKLGKEAAMAWQLGVNQLTDAFSYLNTLSMWIVSLWFSVATVILVPIITKADMVKNKTEFELLRRELLGLTIISSIVSGVLFYVGISVFNNKFSGFNAPTNALILNMIPGMSVFVALGILVSLQSLWIMAYGRHANTLLEAIPPVVFTVIVLVSWSANSNILVAATLVGVFLHLFVTWRISGYAATAPLLSLRSVYWKGIGRGLLAMVAGQVLAGMTILVDQTYVSHLDYGSTSILNYATRYQVLIIAVIALVVSRATLPVLSRLSVNDPVHSARISLAWSVPIFLVAGLGTVTLWWLFPWLVEILLGHGNFSASNEADVVEVARVGVWQTPFYAASMVFTSYFASVQRYDLFLMSGILALLVKLILNYLLVERYGISGLVIASVAMYAATFTYFAILVFIHGRYKWGIGFGGGRFNS